MSKRKRPDVEPGLALESASLKAPRRVELVSNRDRTPDKAKARSKSATKPPKSPIVAEHERHLAALLAEDGVSGPGGLACREDLDKWWTEVLAILNSCSGQLEMDWSPSLEWVCLILGAPEYPSYLKKGLKQNQNGHMCPASHLSLPSFWKSVLRLPNVFIHTMGPQKYCPTADSAEYLLLQASSRAGMAKLVACALGTGTLVFEEKAARLTAFYFYMEAAFDEMALASPEGGSLDTALQSMELSSIWNLFWTNSCAHLPEAPLRYWKHFKPRQLTEEEPMTQARLEMELRKRWLERLVSAMWPYRDSVPGLRAVMASKNPRQEAMDLFGDVRWRTLRTHTNRLLALIKIPDDVPENLGAKQPVAMVKLPWSEDCLRKLLSHLEACGSTPAQVDAH